MSRKRYKRKQGASGLHQIRVAPDMKVKFITSCREGLTWELVSAKLDKAGYVLANYRRIR